EATSKRVAQALGARSAEEIDAWIKYLGGKELTVEQVQNLPDHRTYWVNLIFPEHKRGEELLEYAQEKGWQFSDLLKQIRQLSSNLPSEKLLEGLGLTDEEFTHLTRNDWQKIDLKKISNIAYVMGAKSANDVNAWRQFV